MPDYFLAEHFAAKVGLSPKEIEEFESRGLIRRVVKNARTYYSSRDLYRLKAVHHLMQERGLSLEKAKARVECPGRSAISGAH